MALPPGQARPERRRQMQDAACSAMVPPMSRPRRILYYFHLMNDNTLALTRLRGAQCRPMVMAGPLGGPVHQKPARKESAKGTPWEVLFWTLDDRGKGASPVRASRISLPSG